MYWTTYRVGSLVSHGWRCVGIVVTAWNSGFSVRWANSSDVLVYDEMMSGSAYIRLLVY